MLSKSTTNQLAFAQNTVGTVESTNLAGIFLQIGLKIMTTTAEKIMFPISAGCSIIHALLTYRQLYLEKGKDRATIFRAVVQTISAAAITTVFIGTFTLAAVFASAGPIIFSTVLAVNSLISLGSACYYFGKYSLSKNHNDLEKAKANTIGFIATALGTVAVGSVMLAGQIACAAIGIAAGLIGTIHALYNIYKMRQTLSKTSQQPNKDSPNEDALAQNERLISITNPHKIFSKRKEFSMPDHNTTKPISSILPTDMLAYKRGKNMAQQEVFLPQSQHKFKG